MVQFPEYLELMKSQCFHLNGGVSFCWIGIQYAVPYRQKTLLHTAFSGNLPAGLELNVSELISIAGYKGPVNVLDNE